MEFFAKYMFKILVSFLVIVPKIFIFILNFFHSNVYEVTSIQAYSDSYMPNLRLEYKYFKTNQNPIRFGTALIARHRSCVFIAELHNSSEKSCNAIHTERLKEINDKWCI